MGKKSLKKDVDFDFQNRSRMEVVLLLEEAWSLYPEMRFGQFMENYIIPCMRNGRSDLCIFYDEDEELIVALKQFIKDNQ
jgi:hypothetical protein